MSLRQSGGSERGAGAEGESSCEGRRKEAVGGTGMEPEQPPPPEVGSSLPPAHGPTWKPPLQLGSPRIWGWLQESGLGGDGLGGFGEHELGAWWGTCVAAV